MRKHSKKRSQRRWIHAISALIVVLLIIIGAGAVYSYRLALTPNGGERVFTWLIQGLARYAHTEIRFAHSEIRSLFNLHIFGVTADYHSGETSLRFTAEQISWNFQLPSWLKRELRVSELRIVRGNLDGNIRAQPASSAGAEKVAKPTFKVATLREYITAPLLNVVWDQVEIHHLSVKLAVETGESVLKVILPRFNLSTSGLWRAEALKAVVKTKGQDLENHITLSHLSEGLSLEMSPRWDFNFSGEIGLGQKVWQYSLHPTHLALVLGRLGWQQREPGPDGKMTLRNRLELPTLELGAHLRMMLQTSQLLRADTEMWQDLEGGFNLRVAKGDGLLAGRKFSWSGGEATWRGTWDGAFVQNQFKAALSSLYEPKIFHRAITVKLNQALSFAGQGSRAILRGGASLNSRMVMENDFDLKLEKSTVFKGQAVLQGDRFFLETINALRPWVPRVGDGHLRLQGEFIGEADGLRPAELSLGPLSFQQGELKAQITQTRRGRDLQFKPISFSASSRQDGPGKIEISLDGKVPEVTWAAHKIKRSSFVGKWLATQADEGGLREWKSSGKVVVGGVDSSMVVQPIHLALHYQGQSRRGVWRIDGQGDLAGQPFVEKTLNVSWPGLGQGRLELTTRVQVTDLLEKVLAPKMRNTWGNLVLQSELRADLRSARAKLAGRRGLAILPEADLQIEVTAKNQLQQSPGGGDLARPPLAVSGVAGNAGVVLWRWPQALVWNARMNWGERGLLVQSDWSWPLLVMNEAVLVKDLSGNFKGQFPELKKRLHGQFEVQLRQKGVEFSAGLRQRLGSARPLPESTFQLSGQLHPSGVVQLHGWRGQLLGSLLELQGQGWLELAKKRGRLNGELTVRAERFANFGHEIDGKVQLPWRLSLSMQSLQLEALAKFDEFSWLSPGGQIALKGIEGGFPIQQDWVYGQGQWDLRKVLQLNPFIRVDFEQMRPLVENSHWLRVDNIRYFEKNYGPFIATASLQQNLLSTHKFDLKLGEGELNGQLFADVRPAHLELGLLARLTRLNLSKVLPKMLQASGATENDKTFSARTALTMNLRQRSLNGRMDVTQIDGEQLSTVLNVLDPEFKNSHLNLARMGLGVSYPKEVSFLFNHGFLDLHLKLAGVAQGNIDLYGLPVGALVTRELDQVFQRISQR